MDKQTPTQIATQSMKGCGNRLPSILVSFCGKSCLCPSCKSKILAYRTAWENELEFLKLTMDFTGLDKCMKDWFNSRISELTSALKILEIK